MKPDFERLLRVLVDGGVDFVLVGGYSAMLHGSSLMTRDVDIVCPMEPVQLSRLFEALKPFYPYHRMTPSREPFTMEQISQPGWKNLYLRTDIGILDCLGEVKGLGNYRACLEKSIQLNLENLSFRCLSIEALIEAKTAMGRPKDLQTVEELAMIRRRSSIENNY